MKLYILRHAEAVDRATSDAARELTPRGLEQARRVGAFCRQHGIKPDLILTSPYVRAAQTAAEVAKALDQEAQSSPFLASGMHPATALDELRVYERLDSVLIVGHQPDLGLLIAALLGLKNDEQIAVGKASLTCLDLSRMAAGMATLRFFLPVKLLP